MSKDSVFLVTAPTNAIYMYWVWAEGIDILQSPGMEVCAPYAVGDPIWMKLPGSWCTTRFKHGWVTGVVNQQSVLVNGIPRHICDLWPALETCHSATDESDESSGKKLLIDGTSGPPENVTTSSSYNSEAETMVHIQFQRSTRTKRLLSLRIMCDQEIRGECSSHHTNLWWKRIRVTLCVVCQKNSDLN